MKSPLLVILLLSLLIIGLLVRNQLSTNVAAPANLKSLDSKKISKKVPIQELPSASKESLEEFTKKEQERVDLGAPSEDEK